MSDQRTIVQATRAGATRIVLLAVFALTALAGTAQAATVSVVDGVMTYVADPGGPNDVSVIDAGIGYWLRDLSSPPTAGDGCYEYFDGVLCENLDPEQLTSIYIDGGDGDDVLAFASDYIPTPATIIGGEGDDLLAGGGGADYLDGGDGNDDLRPKNGGIKVTNWQVANGGDGDDTIRGGSGDDWIEGGAGWDTVNYSSRTANLTITANDNTANDGQSGEYDNVRSSVDVIQSGSGNDTLSPSTSPFVRTHGNGGNDTITGNNSYWGEYIYGGSGDDVIYGNNGSDMLYGDSGTNTVYGGNDPDVINVRNSESDIVDCGSANDTVLANLTPLDTSLTNCETINRA